MIIIIMIIISKLSYHYCEELILSIYPINQIIIMYVYLFIYRYMYQTEWLRHVVGKLIPMKYIESLVPKYGKSYGFHMYHY